MSDCQASDWCILQSSSRPKKDLGIRSQQGSGWSCVWFEELRFLGDILDVDCSMEMQGFLGGLL